MIQRVSILKHVSDQRVGISFVAEADDGAGYGALVSRLTPGGLADVAGVCKGDRVLSINGLSVESAPSAASTMRGAVGEVFVVVERPQLWDGFHDGVPAPSEDAAGDAVRKLRGWFAEATTPRGKSRERGLLATMGQGLCRLMAPQQEHDAATEIGAHWRGFRTRALCYVWHWAAREIQRTARGRLVRSYVYPALLERKAAERAYEARRAAHTAREARAVADEARRREEYLRDCRATQEYLEEQERAAAATPAPRSIKKALSFGSKKKRRLPLAADPPTNGEPAKQDSERSNASSGPSTPHAASSRLQYTPTKAPATAPAPKKTVRRTLSWTRRASKQIEANAKNSYELTL